MRTESTAPIVCQSYLVGDGLGGVGDDLRLDVHGGGGGVGDGRGGVLHGRGGVGDDGRGGVGHRVVKARVHQGRVGGRHQGQQGDKDLHNI